MAKGIISQGIGSGGTIEEFLLVGLSAGEAVSGGGRGRRVRVPVTERRMVTERFRTVALPSVTDVPLEPFDSAEGALVMFGGAEETLVLESSSRASGVMVMFGGVEDTAPAPAENARGTVRFDLESQLEDMEPVAWDLFIEGDNRLLRALRRARR